ncbi:Uncharacterized protein PECH_006303 [Penicillium ucsense]|uniref:SGNH hydrolase-type esterase domain-containing protein n=1 Tax=Penicillium ucsense TaxID=2839758 RepID=A0A8J8W8U8_9EURO|nr:Uncharacterized protein PECM_000346 [Penicillium ucsense]KAF7739099.1 Uncharacterized protein PECH_006303 [Penicillium ucsense]
MSATDAQAKDVNRSYDQIILFGDSITEMSWDQSLGFGYGAALSDAYRRKLDVVNRGFGGYTTAHAIKIAHEIVPSPDVAKVRLMTIFFGANDACVPSHVQHVPLEIYKENLQKIIQHPATRAQNPRLVIITPPPVDEYQLEGFDKSKDTVYPSRTAQRAKEYAEAAKEVGASLKIPVADIWTAFMAAVGWQEGQALIGSRETPMNSKFGSLFTDGLHLTAAGYRLVYDEVRKTIRAHYPDQDSDALPMLFPAWGEAPR